MVSFIDFDDVIQPESQPTVKIRKATLEDAYEIYRVMKAAFYPLASRGYPKKAIDQTISKPWKIRDRILSASIFLIAEIDDEIVGTVTGFEEHDSMRVSSLGVHPEHQYRGIGTELFETLESIAIENKNHKLFLVTAWVMTEAIQLYRTLGYRKEGYLRSHYYGEDLIVFSKYLFQEDDDNWSSSGQKQKTQRYSWPLLLF
ncbi:MAG: GNAT family N-acetyltransferase [Candidatus Sifarchaeia archaeon]